MKQKSKIWVIFKHEYMTKVKSKGFILSTLLLPLGSVLVIGVIALVTWLSMDDTSKKLAVVDDSNKFGSMLIESDTSRYYRADKSLNQLRDEVQEGLSDGFVYIHKDFFQNGKIELVTGGGGGLGYVSALKSTLSDMLYRERLQTYVDDPEIRKLLRSGVSLDKVKLDEEGTEQADHTELLAGLGYMFGMIVYFMMLMYGAMVMRSCIEEKANRIVEIIASSAKPHEIMMSKITAIGALGLTQMLIWSLMGIAVMGAGIPMLTDAAAGGSPMAADVAGDFGLSADSLPEIPFGSILGLIFFFISGFLIYATLFAAVGSAVDQEQDAQQLQAPLIIPLIIPIFMITNIITNPDSTLAAVLSIFPFFAPILMPVRLAATNVPIWQTSLCVALLAITFLVCVRIAGKIYRVGIMMYGSQPKIKDLIRWIKLAK